jgi:uncharacterized protein DUF6545
VTTALRTACLLLGCIIFLYKAIGVVRGQRDRTTVVFCLYVGLSALSYLVLLPPIKARIDVWTGMAHSSGLAAGVCVLGLTAAQQYLLIHWTYSPELARPKLRRRGVFWTVVLVAYVAMYLVFGPGQQQFHYFFLENAHKVWQAPYLLLYVLACVVGQADVVRHCRHYAKIADRAWLRRGMLTAAVGGGFILLYGTIRATDLVAEPLGVDMHSLEPVTWALGDTGALLSLFGWILPMLGPRLSSTAQWFRDYRTYRRLYPLWQALHQEVPEISLGPPPSRFSDVLRLRDVGFWLHRRVIEIQDGLRALRSRTDDSPSGDVRAAIASAAARVSRRGDMPAASEDRDFDDEVRWLSELAGELVAYRRAVRRCGWSAEYPVRTSFPDARS